VKFVKFKVYFRYCDLKRFSKWQPSTIFDLFGAYLDYPQRTLDGFCHFAKFGCDQCSSFDYMEVSILLHLLENAYLCPKIGI